MRRKSQRGASKVTPEKPVETATRRSRRHSKRRKRSSSRSSNEESHETPPPIDSQQSKSPEQPPQISNPDDDTEEPVWKVKASAAPSGEIQKIKLCLTRPVLSSPEKTELPSKRRRNKSSSRIDEDVTSSEDVVVTPTRKSRHRGSSGIEIEEVEDKKGKGKSKSKNKSKHDKSQEIQEVKDETQNQISENIQVTPQSPQAASDIRVDNEIVSNNENDSINEDSNSQINITIQFSDSTIIDENKSADVTTCIQNLDTKIETSVTKSDDESESHTPTASVDDTADVQKIEASSVQVVELNLEEQNTESVCEEKQEEIVQVEQNQIEDQIEKTNFAEKIEETKIIEDQVQVSLEQVTETCSDNQSEETEAAVKTIQVGENCTATVTEEDQSEMQVTETEKKDVEVSDTNKSKHTEVAAESESKAEVQTVTGQGELKSGGTSSDEADREEGEKQPLILEKMDISEDSNQIVADEKQLSDEEAISVDTIINLNSTKDDDAKEEITATKIIRKRKWGKSLVGLELTNLSKNISMEAIQELCPTLKFLEENEIQIELKDRRKSSDNIDRTSSRKVSIEYKTTDRLETQTSFSSEVSETVEAEIDNSNIIAMNRKISIVDDTAGKLKSPPSPAKNPLSQVLYITNLVRPFTLKQLKELLERTGKLTENGFWTDRIKSKCYVCYETVDEAEATRNALHGVHWPICNGKKLVIEYSSPEELDKARNPTPPPVILQPVIPEKEDVENQSPPKRARLEDEEKFKKERPITKSEQHVREWDIGKEDLHRRRSRSQSPREVRNDRHDRNERNDRRKYKRSLTPIEDVINKKKVKEDDVPQKLMDDLFQRTKATPSIYWLPLTPEEIATKQQQRLLRMAEHKRRMEESSRSRGDYGRGVPYRRRYD